MYLVNAVGQRPQREVADILEILDQLQLTILPQKQVVTMPHLTNHNLQWMCRLPTRWILEARPLVVPLPVNPAVRVQEVDQAQLDIVDLINNNENVLPVHGNLLVKLQQRDYLIGPASTCR